MASALLVFGFLTLIGAQRAIADSDAIEVLPSSGKEYSPHSSIKSAEAAGIAEEVSSPEESAGLVSGDDAEAAKSLEPSPKTLTLPLAEGSLYVEAYESLTYDRPNRTVVLDGDALMVMGNLQVEADHIEINDSAKNAYLRGSIAIQQADDVIFADEGYLSYDTDEFALVNVSGNTSGPQVDGVIYFRAEEAKGRFEDFTMSKVWMSTCPPTCIVYEYELTAKSARMKRDKVLLLYRVYGYAREHKIMFLPQLAIPLKRYRALRQTRSPIEQNYGYNRREGAFAKFAYTYDERFVESVSPSLLGVMLLDITQKQGTGFGLRQDFLSPLGVTSLKGKYQRQYQGPIVDEETGERGKPDRNYELGLSQELNFTDSFKGKFTVKRENRYLIYRSRTNTMNSDFNLGYTGGNFSSTLSGRQSLNIRGGYTTTTGSEVALRKDSNGSLSFNNTFRINRLTTLTFAPSMSQRKTNDGLPADLEGKLMSNLQFRRQDYTVTLKYQESAIDLDGDRYTKDDRISVNNIKPGLELRFPRTSFGEHSPFTGLTLAVENVTNKLRSETEKGPVLRFRSDTGMSRSFGQGETRLSPTLNFSQYMYDDGNAQYILRPGVRLDYNNDRWFKSNFSWSRTVQHGVKNPPVRGDAVRSRNNANLSMQFYQDPIWNLQLRSSYNFIAQRWGSINSTLNLDPSPDFGVTFTTSYSIENETFQPLSSNWDFRSPVDNWYLRVNLTTPLQGYSLTHRPIPIERLTWTYSRQYKRGWSFYLYGTQTGSSKGALFDRVQIRKRNTCTTLDFGYIGGRKEYYLSIFINAFPTYPVKAFAKEQPTGWDFWVSTPTGYESALQRGLTTGFTGYTGYGYGATGGGWSGTYQPQSGGGPTLAY